uniref:THIF-type NAD/FAD binding fold domain-containing protein n=1 Tax=Globodera rostochiensis TaxID=31243 RepID=A0A914HH01_GLORO
MTMLSTDETRIYDRQIRLWGMQAQNRLRNSSVLIIGLTGLGAEIAKNLMLAGLKSLTLMDDKEVTDEDYTSNFLLVHGTKMNRAEASYENLKLLNPMVDLTVQTELPDYETTSLINKKCRQNRIRFEAGSVFGWVGYAFFDFNNHTFLISKPKEKDAIVESVLDEDCEDGLSDGTTAKKMKMNGAGSGGTSVDNTQQTMTLTIGDEEDSKIKKNVSFPSFEHTFAVELGSKRFIRRKFNFPSTYFVVRAFFGLMRGKAVEITHERVVDQWQRELSNIGSDETKQKISAEDFSLFVCPALNPVCAIVGSIIAQEAIKSLSQNDEPLKSTFFYSALESCGTVVDMA